MSRRSSRLVSLPQVHYAKNPPSPLSPRSLRAIKRQRSTASPPRTRRKPVTPPPPDYDDDYPIFSPLHPLSPPAQPQVLVVRDKEANIWKFACQERVRFYYKRYGVHAMRALVALETSSPSEPNFCVWTPENYQDDMVDDDSDDDDEEEDEFNGLNLDLSSPTPLPTPTSPSLPPLPPSSPLSSVLVPNIELGMPSPESIVMGRGTPPDERRRKDWADANPDSLRMARIPRLGLGFDDQGMDVRLDKTLEPTVYPQMDVDGINPNPGEWTSYLKSCLPSPPAPTLGMGCGLGFGFGFGFGFTGVVGMGGANMEGGWFELGHPPSSSSPMDELDLSTALGVGTPNGSTSSGEASGNTTPGGAVMTMGTGIGMGMGMGIGFGMDGFEGGVSSTLSYALG